MEPGTSRPPIQKMLPALDEAQKVLQEFAKDIADEEMQEAVAKQLEASINEHY